MGRFWPSAVLPVRRTASLGSILISVLSGFFSLPYICNQCIDKKFIDKNVLIVTLNKVKYKFALATIILVNVSEIDLGKS